MARAFISNFSQQRSHSSSTKSSLIVLILPCHSFRWSVGEVLDHGIGHRAHQEQESPIAISLFRPSSSPPSPSSCSTHHPHQQAPSSPTSTQNKASSSRRFRPSSSPTSTILTNMHLEQSIVVLPVPPIILTNKHHPHQHAPRTKHRCLVGSAHHPHQQTFGVTQLE